MSEAVFLNRKTGVLRYHKDIIISGKHVFDLVDPGSIKDWIE